MTSAIARSLSLAVGAVAVDGCGSAVIWSSGELAAGFKALSPLAAPWSTVPTLVKLGAAIHGAWQPNVESAMSRAMVRRVNLFGRCNIDEQNAGATAAVGGQRSM
jgi:hypothetical protein